MPGHCLGVDCQTLTVLRYTPRRCTNDVCARPTAPSQTASALGQRRDLKGLTHQRQCVQSDHPLALYNAGVLRANGAVTTLKGVKHQTRCVQSDHPLALYNAGVLRANGAVTAADCSSAVVHFSRLTRARQLVHLANGKTAVEDGDSLRALWHYLVASEAGIALGSLNAAWLISHGCACPFAR